MLNLVGFLDTIYSLWDNFSKRKLLILKDSLGKNGATGKAKDILQEQMNSKYISYTTGIKVDDKYLQERLIELYELAHGFLTLREINRASCFCESWHNGDLKFRKFTKLDKLKYRSSILIAGLFFLTGLSLVIAYGFLPIKPPALVLMILLMAFSFIIGGCVIASTGSKYLTAKKVVRVKKKVWRNREKISR